MELPDVKRFRIVKEEGPLANGRLEENRDIKFIVELDRGSPRKLETVVVGVRFSELDFNALAGGRVEIEPFRTRARAIARSVVVPRLRDILALTGTSKGELFLVTGNEADDMAGMDPDRIEIKPGEWVNLPTSRRASTERRVFICHAEVDKAIANILRDYLLRAKPNVQVFVASHPEDLPGGRQWWDEIRDNLSKASVVLTLVTVRSKDRPWLHFESGGALFQGTPPIPLAVPPIRKEFPLPLGVLQGFDLGVADDVAALIGQLSDELKVRFDEPVEALGRGLSEVFSTMPPQPGHVEQHIGDAKVVLDGAWRKLKDALGAADTVYAPLKRSPELDRMPTELLEEFLSESDLGQYQRNEIRRSAEKTKYYSEVLQAQEINRCWQRIGDLREFVEYGRIYIQPDLADEFLACAHGLSVAMIDRETALQMREPPFFKEGREGVQKVREKVNAIEARLRSMLGKAPSA
jgi:hypothetical protein